MFEKTREVTRKDKYGFIEEGSQRRAVIMGTTAHTPLSKRELALMAAVEPIQAGDIRYTDAPGPYSRENPLLTVTVTSEILGGTRNLVFDGQELYLVHGERRYSLHDEALLHRRAEQLGVRVADLKRVITNLEETVKQKIILLTKERESTSIAAPLSSHR